MDILSTHVDKLHIVAEELMKYEKISGERFARLMADDYNPADEIKVITAPKTPAETARTAAAEIPAEFNPAQTDGTASTAETAETATDTGDTREDTTDASAENKPRDDNNQ